MPSAVHQRGPASAEMNITPLIDVVFQLIIFFMLVNNIVSSENLEMVVPKLEDARTREMTEDNRVVVNMAPLQGRTGTGNPLLIDGTAGAVQVSLSKFHDMSDLSGVTAMLQEARAKNPEVEVLLRADSALYYEEVQPLMSAITAAGVGTVNLVAYMPDKGPAQGQAE